MYVYMYILYVYMEVCLKYTYVKSFLLNIQKLQSNTDILFCKKINILVHPWKRSLK